MKKVLLFALGLTFFLSYGQMADNSYAPNITLTDIEGNQFDLYSELDAGKTVILDLFATWCGPCWSFAEGGVLESLQNNYGDYVRCVAIEADPSTSASELYNSSLGDWTSIMDYTIIDDASGNVANDYELSFYPTIYKICPDRMVSEVGQLNSPGQYMSQVNQCSSASYSKDAKIISYGGDNIYCDGILENASVVVQNYNMGSTMSNFDILTKVNGQVVETTPWSGTLNQYEVASVNINGISGIPDGADISFEVSYSGDMDASNNTISPQISGAEETSPTVRLSLLTDNYPEEISWQLFDSYGNVVESTNVVDCEFNGTTGDYAGQANQQFEIDWTLDSDCYKFEMYDAYGDGLMSAQWGGTDGLAELIDLSTNTVLWSTGQVEFGGDLAATGTPAISGAFSVLGSSTNIQENTNTEISVFPNPFKDYTTLRVTAENGQDVNIEIYNLLGKVVYSNHMPFDKNELKIESNQLAPGQYYINVLINGESNLKKLSVIE